MRKVISHFLVLGPECSPKSLLPLRGAGWSTSLTLRRSASPSKDPHAVWQCRSDPQPGPRPDPQRAGTVCCATAADGPRKHPSEQPPWTVRHIIRSFCLATVLATVLRLSNSSNGRAAPRPDPKRTLPQPPPPVSPPRPSVAMKVRHHTPHVADGLGGGSHAKSFAGEKKKPSQEQKRLTREGPACVRLWAA